MRIGLVSIAVLAVSLSACVRRGAPYRFRGALVGAVGQDALDLRAGGDDEAPAPVRSPARPEPSPVITPAAIALAERPPATGGFQLARPRHGAPSAAPSMTDRLRAQVGQRRDDDGMAFVLAMLESAGERAGDVDRAVARVPGGDALVELARERSAVRDPSAVDVGDLLVFSPVDPDPVVALVASVDERGTLEYVYLARGVVRRGYVTPARPGERRDEIGRVLNTFVRVTDVGLPRGTRTLAGELLIASIDRRALAR